MQGRFEILLIFFISAAFVGGRDIYVAPGGANNYPYTNWQSAAARIEWAVNVGVNGDTVWISNGVYVLTNQIVVNSNLTICGNPGELVVVDGNNANRCFSFPSSVNKGGVLSNLFITGGFTNGHGGGVYMYSGRAIDCVFSNNSCLSNAYHGGGMYLAYTGTVQRCTFIANISSSNGGGLCADNITLVEDSRFVTNVAGYRGGGAYLNSSLMVRCYLSNNIALEGGGCCLYSGTASNCLIARNQCLSIGNDGGGGVALRGGALRNCTVEENRSAGYGGGVGSYNGSLRNCLIRNNVAVNRGGGFRRNGGSVMVINSCTIVSNCAAGGGGGIYDGSAATYGMYDNCIIYFNKGGSLSNYYFFTGHIGSSFSNCCFSPELPAGSTSVSTNSIYSDPQFVNWEGGDYHLARISPCVNAGAFREWMTNALDMDGYLRIDKFSGIVDMGCYEYIFLNGIVTSIE